MHLLRRWITRFFGYQPTVYNPVNDPLLLKYVAQEERLEKLWRPREMFDV